MNVTNDSVKLKAVPFQLVDIQEGIILKRGCTELKVVGEGASATVRQVLSILTAHPATYGEIAQRFSASNHSLVQNFLDKLIERRFLITSATDETIPLEPESHLDIFYWHFGSSTNTINQRLNQKCTPILGVNYISRQLVIALTVSGIYNLQVIDHPMLRNLRMFNGAGNLWPEEWPNSLPEPCTLRDWVDKVDISDFSCLVATSDFGDKQVMSEWNRFCVDNNRHFLPLVLKNVVGYLGPLVVPGETACLECLHSRQNSNLNEPPVHQAIDTAAFAGQLVNGFHPSMAFVIGDLAAFELTKFYCDALPNRNVGMLIEINLLASCMSSRKVLKAPRCKVCSNLHSTSPTTFRTYTANPEKWNSL